MPLISARTAWITAVALSVCLAAGIAAGVATGTHGAYNPGLPHGEQPGDGALMVGGGVAILVGMLMRIAYVLHERRREPNKTYSTRRKHGLTAQQYLRLLTAYLLLPAALCVMGLVLRRQYG